MDESEPLLKGIKVVEIATYIFGPGSAAILSDFGADVIKIEAPGRGDPLRYAHKAPPFMPLEFGYIWQQDNRNKRSIGLDMKSTEGREVLLKLVREADILITNFNSISRPSADFISRPMLRLLRLSCCQI